MTEPPRPSDGYNPEALPSDPTASPASYSDPGEAPSAGSAASPSAPPSYGPPSSAPPSYGPPSSAPPSVDYPAGDYPPPGGKYAPPPGGDYPPAGGYPPHGSPYGSPYGAAAAPAGYATSDEKTWALIAHFGGILAGFIAPLVAMLAKGNESPTVRAHAVEALNFQITWGIANIVAVIIAACTLGFLFFLPMITWLILVIFSVLGGVKANEGVLYHYPMSIRMVK